MSLFEMLMFAVFPMMIVEGEGGGESIEVADPNATNVVEVVTPEKTVAETAPPIEDQMLEGIKAALKPDPQAQKVADEAAAKKKTDEDFATANKGKAPEELAALKVTADADALKKKEAEEAAKLKGKKADDFQLTPELKKALSQDAQQRFHELHRYGKTQEAEVARLTQQNTGLSAARDQIMSLFEEHAVAPDDLVALLDYNKRVKSGDLAGALRIVDEARTGILKAMGKEAPGVDLLDEFPDLKAKVDAMDMPRENALEVANARRRDAATATVAERARAENGQFVSAKNAQDAALAGIEAWTKEIAGKDIDYKKKEEKVLAKLDSILKTYPPALWLPTIKMQYEAIEVAKLATPTNGAGQPLRPSGAKPGAKIFTELTPEALRAGLGYPAVS